MKIIIEIPDYEFNNDVKDKFQDYFNRVKQDIADGTLCGNYELETTDMFLASFKRMQILPNNATNGNVYELVFGKKVSKNSTNEWWNKKYEYNSN